MCYIVCTYIYIYTPSFCHVFGAAEREIACVYIYIYKYTYIHGQCWMPMLLSSSKSFYLSAGHDFYQSRKKIETFVWSRLSCCVALCFKLVIC